MIGKYISIPCSGGGCVMSAYMYLPPGDTPHKTIGDEQTHMSAYGSAGEDSTGLASRNTGRRGNPSTTPHLLDDWSDT